MKLNKSIIALSFLLFGLSACNTDDLEKDINDLKDWVTQMETQVQALNDNMNILRVALDGNKTIQKCTDNGDGTYTLLLSDGSTMTLTQGVEGSEFYPKISIDGDGYWVIDGVKQPYKAKAEPGKDGVDPKFRLDAEGDKFYWSVSYDEGVRYNPLLDVNGNKVQANAETSIPPSEGGPISDVLINGDCLEFMVSGQKYSIPIVEGLKCIITIPEDAKDGDFCIVPTKAPLVLDLEIGGDYCLANASAGWSAVVSEDNTKLTITAPGEADVEGEIVLQVNKGISWAIEKIKVKSRYIITSYKEAYDQGMDLDIAGLVVNKTTYPDVTLINSSSSSKTISSAGVYFIAQDAGEVNCSVGSKEIDKLIIISDAPGKKVQVKFSAVKLKSDNVNPVMAMYGLDVDYSNMTKADPLTLLAGNKDSEFYMDMCKVSLPERQFVELTASTPTFNKFIIKNSELRFNFDRRIENKNIISIKGNNENNINDITVENNLFYNASLNSAVIGFGILKGKESKIETLNLKNNTIINIQSSNTTSAYSYFYCKGITNINIEKNIFWYNQDMSLNSNCVVRPSVKHENKFVINSNIGYSLDKDVEVDKDGNIVKQPVNIQLFYGSTAPAASEPLEQLMDSPLEISDISNGVYTITNELYSTYGYQRK